MGATGQSPPRILIIGALHVYIIVLDDMAWVYFVNIFVSFGRLSRVVSGLHSMRMEHLVRPCYPGRLIPFIRYSALTCHGRMVSSLPVNKPAVKKNHQLDLVPLSNRDCQQGVSGVKSRFFDQVLL